MMTKVLRLNKKERKFFVSYEIVDFLYITNNKVII